MKLYSFYNSGPSYRVRIALALKGLKPEMEYIDLTKAAHKTADYAKINKQMMVPTLIDNGHTLTQSIAIMEYLDEVYPTPAILPKDPFARAHVRAIAHAIASDIAPLGNLRIRKYFTNELKQTEAATEAWTRQWIVEGFTALEKILSTSPLTGTYCVGEIPTIADCCLVPQVSGARRWKVDLSLYPTLMRIADACEKHPAFIFAHPMQQVDAPK